MPPLPRLPTPRLLERAAVAAPELDASRIAVARRLKRARELGQAEPADFPHHGDERVASLVGELNASLDADTRADAAGRLGALYATMGHVDDAARALKTVLAYRAHDAAALTALSALYAENGRFVSLVELLEQGLPSLGSDEQKQRRLLEIVELRRGPLGDPVSALESLRAAAVFGPVSELAMTLARTLEASGLVAPAVLAYSLVDPEGEPAPERALKMGSLLLHQLRSPAKALPLLEIAAAVLPEAKGELALARAATGDTPGALALVNEIGEIGEIGREAWSAGGVHAKLALILDQQGADREIVRHLNTQAFEGGDRSSTLLERLDQQAVAAKDWDLVARVVEAQLLATQQRRNPEATESELRDLSVRLGHLYYKRLDRPLDAARHFIQAFRLHPSDLGLYRVIESLLAKQAPDEAQRQLQAEMYEAFLFGARASTRDRVTTAVKLAAVLESQGKSEEALNRLRDLPSTPEVVTAIERLLTNSERHAELAALLRERLSLLASGLSPGLTSVSAPLEGRSPLLRRLARVLETGLRDLAAATDCHLELLEEQPEDLGTLRALGRLLEAQRRWDELLSCSGRELALLTEPKQRAYVFFRMGSLQETQLGQLDLAAASYHSALECDPRCFPAHHGLRELAVNAGDWVKVVDHLGRELASWDDPRERASILARIAEIKEERLGDHEGALSSHRLALAINPANQLALTSLAADAVSREAFEEAAAHYQVLSTLNLDKWPRTQRAEVFFRRGLVAKRLSRSIEAAECAKLALELAPDHDLALSLLVSVEPLLRPDAAFAELWARLDAVLTRAERAGDLARQTHVLVLRGEVRFKLLELDAAHRELERAAEVSPADQAALRARVELLLAERRIDDAAAVLGAFSGAPLSDRGPTPAARMETLFWEADLLADLAMDPARAIACLDQLLCAPLLTPALRCDALYKKAQCQALQSHLDDARQTMETCVALGRAAALRVRTQALHQTYLGRMNQELGGFDTVAIGCYQTALDLDVQCAPAALALLRGYESLGQPDAVDALIVEHPAWLELPSLPEAAAGLLVAYMARIRRARGDLEGARLLLTRLTQREGPTTRDARFAIVRAAVEAGPGTSALATLHLTRLLERDPTDVQALRELGDVVKDVDEYALQVFGALELFGALSPADRPRFEALTVRARRVFESSPRPLSETLITRYLAHPAWFSPILQVIGPLDVALASQFRGAVLPGLRSAPHHDLELEAHALMSLLGFTGVEVCTSTEASALVSLLPAERPSLVLGPAALAPPMRALHRRFAMARALCYARAGLARLHDLNAERAVELMRLMEGLFSPSAEGSPREGALLDHLPKDVAERLRAELNLRRQSALPAIYTGESALVGVAYTADRTGLVVCGALRPAVEALAFMTGAVDLNLLSGLDLTFAVRGSSRLKALVSYALSEDHRTLRRAAGLVI